LGKDEERSNNSKARPPAELGFVQDRKNGCRCGQENIDELLQTLAKNCGEILNGL
jgi:hypothetical protein